MNVPGVSVAVINDGKIEWARGYGVRENGTDKKIDTETLFQAGSISKPFAATAALTLVEAGKLSLNKEANYYLESWKVPENEFTKKTRVTVKHVLAHYAGFTHYGFRGYKAGEKVPTLVELLQGAPVAGSPPVEVLFEPGSRFSYSNGGYYVLQQILEDVTGESFPRFMDKVLLKPLGLKNSAFSQPLAPSLRGNAAAGHHLGSGKVQAGKYYTFPGLATGGLWSTATDIAGFAMEIQKSLAGKSNKVLSREMTWALVNSRELESGLGMGSEGEGDSLSFSFAGSTNGFLCWMTAFVNTGKGAVVMTNSDNGILACAEILRSISRVYDWPAVRPSDPLVKRPAELDPRLLKALPGRYKVDKRIEVEVFEKEGKLYLKDNDSFIEDRLYPEGGGKFFLSWSRGHKYEFVLDEKNGVELTMVKFGRTFRGKKTTADPGK